MISLNIINKYKHKLLIQSVFSLIENKQYILKDFFYENKWVMVLFFEKTMIVAINNLDNGEFDIIDFDLKSMFDFEKWKEHKHFNVLKEIIKKSHDKEKKKTFLIARVEHLIEDLGNFFKDRNTQNKMDIFKNAKIFDKLLSEKYSDIYIKNEINNGNSCEGKSFD